MSNENIDTPITDKDPSLRLPWCGCTHEVVSAELCRQLERELAASQAREQRLRDALSAIAPFVMEDYQPEFATPLFKAAVENMHATLSDNGGES